MTFVPGRRRKKHTTSSRSIPDVNSTDEDDLEWIDESNEDNVCQIQTEDNRSISIIEGDRKRKFPETIDESKRLDEERYITSVNLLHLREIGAFKQNCHRRLCRQRSMCLLLNRKSWISLLLRKVSPASSIPYDDDNDSTADNANSQWADYSPPIYNSQYFNGTTTHSSVPLNRQMWRKKQIIPFSKLKTPMMDAILAIDRTGGYLIGIGGESLARREHSHKHDCSAKLLLKFYGIPSPDRLQKSEMHQNQIVSPLIHSVPLLFENNNSGEHRFEFGFNEYSAPAAETPLQILLSDDKTLGVAFLRNATESCAWTSATNESSQDKEILGSLVIFEMPPIVNSSSRLTRSYHCSNVRIGGWNSFTFRNCIWPTTVIPTKCTTHQVNGYLCDSFRRVLSAHILLNDEDDGFRISWVTSFGSTSQKCCFLHRPGGTRPSRRDILTIPDENVWELITSHSGSGRICQNVPNIYCSGLKVAFEIYLSVDALLSDILDRRKHSSMFGKSPYQNDGVRFMPDYCYELISVVADEMAVILVLVFSNREKMIQATKKVASAMGVFLRLNLYDQSYDELQWVCHSSSRSLKSWCTSLALNWRMRENRVGVFCVGPTIVDTWSTWSCGTHEHNCNDDLDDDTNVALWSEYVRKRSRKTKELAPPKNISMSSLYPSCDVVTNRAVLTAVPLTRMTSRQSPIEVVYG